MTWRERLFDLSEAGRVSLLRLVALAYVAFAIMVWARLLGVDLGFMRPGTDGPAQAVAVVLAVLCPVTAVGLWSLAAWGQVVWAITMAVHAAAILNGWPLVEEPGIVLTFHIACVTTFALLVLARLVANKG